MRSAALQCLAILHERLDCKRIDRTGETLVGRFVTDDHRQAHPLLGELLIYVNHAGCLLDSLFLGGMSRMPLLPEEFGRAQEQTRTHLPTNHVGPLVAQDRQIPIRLDPSFIGVPDNRLRGGANDQLLFEFGIGVDHHAFPIRIVFQTVVGYDGTLLGEAFDMAGLFREKRLGNEEREVGVFMPCLLEHFVQRRLHLLPDGIAIGLDDHAPAHRRVLGQTGLYYQVVVPLRIVVLRLGHVFEFLCHYLRKFLRLIEAQS